MNFALAQYHKYSIAEIENLMAWETEIYVVLLLRHLEEERERMKDLKMQRK